MTAAPFTDPRLPHAASLVWGGGVAALEDFFARRGWRLVAARPVQALYRPGRSLAVRHRVRAIPPRGPVRSLTATIEATTRPRETFSPPADFGARFGIPDPVEADPDRLVYVYPFDPSLPDLPAAATPDRARAMLGTAGRRALAVAVEPLRYRPRRRAVFRYLGRRAGERLEHTYAKVLRPGRAGAALAAARALRSGRRFSLRTHPTLCGPLAGEEGALLFAPARGSSLRDLLLNDLPVPSPDRVAAVLDGLRSVDAGSLPAADPSDPVRAARHAVDTIAVLVPEARARAERVLDAVSDGVTRAEVSRRPVHGDLYEAQIFVDEHFRLSLIDLDDVHLGDPAIDAGNFLAHLVALAYSVPRAADRLFAYRSLAREAFLHRLGMAPPDLAWREALAMLLLATGPFCVLDARWPVEVADRVEAAVGFLSSS